MVCGWLLSGIGGLIVDLGLCLFPVCLLAVGVVLVFTACCVRVFVLLVLLFGGNMFVCGSVLLCGDCFVDCLRSASGWFGVVGGTLDICSVGFACLLICICYLFANAVCFMLGVVWFCLIGLRLLLACVVSLWLCMGCFLCC